MRTPPALSARQLFWWGVGLLGAGVVLEVLLLPVHLHLEVGVVPGAVLSVLVSTAKLLGAAVIAAALTVAALRAGRPESPAAPGPYRRPDQSVG